MIDELNGELWSKAAKGTSDTIRIPLSTGIAGHVAMSGELVNIQEAYTDSRFNRDVDIKNKYRTKTILACPIKDKKGGIIGVIQAINKIDGYFTRDD